MQEVRNDDETDEDLKVAMHLVFEADDEALITVFARVEIDVNE